MKSHILYIAVDYTGVHQSLHQSLSRIGEYDIIVYIPLNYRLRNRTYQERLPDGSRVISSTVIEKWDKWLYYRKIQKMVDYIVRQNLDWSRISLIHATTCCVEGAIAYELSKRFHIPYIVAVRNTDLNTYYKYLFWHRGYFRKILYDSQRVIFISHRYKDKTITLFHNVIQRKHICQKSEVVFNGVNSSFLLNRVSRKTFPFLYGRIVYVGAINRNKNLLNVIKAIALLRKDGWNISYTIVGKGKRGEETGYLEQVERESHRNSWIKLLPEQSSEALIDIYRQSDIFAMCSFHETFGLVYAEALSQGIPIIYSEGEGFDGVFPEGEVGYHAIPSSPQDIANKLRLVLKNYEEISRRVSALSLEQFDWDGVAQHYTALYKICGKFD
ncbi:glycosyltransferase family 4 protein [Parabacteroides sp.]|uniref:glycosyltransferase family 4 protein n=1 Tax=Parabacteroides sp. TaxID=1869337 RepID=UPI002580DB20|nr:glycosyltransferase family 4 protein [Parabacteroides sp.]